MIQNYQKHIAKHYAAYRPPLHQLILATALPTQKTFCRGLDIGCGTGYSAIALANHCQQVLAIDPSESMLAKAQDHTLVEYQLGSGERIPCGDKQFDLVSFAGSLFYIEAQQCLSELKRITADNNTVIVYDFEILIDEYLRQFDLTPQQVTLDYDHMCQFTPNKHLQSKQKIQKQITLTIKARDLAHVILSDQYRYQLLAARLSAQSLFKAVLKYLPAREYQLMANIYYTTYHIVH